MTSSSFFNKQVSDERDIIDVTDPAHTMTSKMIIKFWQLQLHGPCLKQQIYNVHKLEFLALKWAVIMVNMVTW